MDKIHQFTDLIAWQKGHLLVLSIYKISSLFPQRESFALTDQMRRAVVSITSNIAEGFSRHSNKEKIQFYYMSLGSVTEIQNQILIARDLGYITSDVYEELREEIILVHKLLNGLIKSIRLSQ